ncbi:hypothetical protein [Paenirhodobacter populi]|uniref:hypothetical protein n=1 Tax=Paenirhodobacter populi TaxID=2306993 RepID=UPI001F502912|nr:hypothetical protein [Sinirhodobacter populi]
MKSGHDLEGLMRFLGRDDIWRERLQDVLDEHFGPAMEEFDVDFEELGDIVGDHWPMTLWGCAFEDLLSREYGQNHENIIDQYLKRRGWSEKALNRAYIEGLRHAVISLYEVVEVQPDDGLILRNLLSDEELINVREKSATRSLKKWDKIAVRVVPRRDHHVISGGLLPFSAAATEMLTDGIRQVLKLKKTQDICLDRVQLHRCAPLFVTAWLFMELDRAAASQELPEMTNSDGDPLVFHEVRFPFAQGVLQKDIAAWLGKVKGLEADGVKTWHWLAAKKRGAAATKRLSGEAPMFDEATVLGMLELKGKTLVLTVNSAARAERGIAMVTKATGGLLCPPFTSITTVEQMMSEQNNDRDHPESASDDIPPKIVEQIIREQMDRHYRDTLDQSIPALGTRPPGRQ